MINKRITLLNCPVDVLTMEETIVQVQKAIDAKEQIHHTVVNAGKLAKMQHDEVLRESVISADIINADGQPLVWLSKALKTPLPERVAGIELMQKLVERAKENHWKLFFFGATEEIVTTVVEKYSELYTNEIIAGYRNGYYKPEEEKAIAEKIGESGANILFVAITSPKKENFLHKYKEILKDVNFIMGVGGSFDVVAGKVKRAPLWMQKAGLEWFYRVIQEPRRMFKRYLTTNIQFIFHALKQLLSKG